tara:strand:+ start:13827 stop:15242 length:1416 start_codon:yes stop_codon:yes gene_type:complete
MAKLGINTGTTPNDGTGDSLLSGAIKVNSNFDEIYSALGDGSVITNSIDFAVVAGYSTASGIATYAVNAGVATYADTAGIATNATLAATATFATNAGIASEATFASGLNNTPNITVGIVTATSFEGAGQAISGIVTYIVAGDNIGIDTNFGQVTVSTNKADDFPSKWVQSGVGIHTFANVGINTNNPLADLHLHGASMQATDGSSINLDDNIPLNLGSAGASDSTVFFDGTDLILKSGSKLTIKGVNTKLLDAPNAEGPILYYNGVEKLQIQQHGIDVDGKVEISGDIAAVGVITASAFTGDGANLTALRAEQLQGGPLPVLDGQALTGIATMRSKVSVAATALGVIHTGVGFTTFDGFNTYSLLKVGVSTENVRVRLYADITSRNNDTGRAPGVAHSTAIHLIYDELIGENAESYSPLGVAGKRQVVAPAVTGFNMEDSNRDGKIFATFDNYSGVATDVTAILEIVRLEF